MAYGRIKKFLFDFLSTVAVDPGEIRLDSTTDTLRYNTGAGEKTLDGNASTGFTIVDSGTTVSCPTGGVPTNVNFSGLVPSTARAVYVYHTGYALGGGSSNGTLDARLPGVGTARRYLTFPTYAPNNDDPDPALLYWLPIDASGQVEITSTNIGGDFEVRGYM